MYARNYGCDVKQLSYDAIKPQLITNNDNTNVAPKVCMWIQILVRVSIFNFYIYIYICLDGSTELGSDWLIGWICNILR